MKAILLITFAVSLALLAGCATGGRVIDLTNEMPTQEVRPPATQSDSGTTLDFTKP
ncbi:MAG: hypothetical protein AAFX93_19015 [Verrucomicrobiota bacterium]